MILFKSGKQSPSKASSETLADVYSSLSTTLKNLNQGGQIKPSAAVQRTSYYNAEGSFESYYQGEVPKEFLTDPKMFTDYEKLTKDTYYKAHKLDLDLQMEKEEFERTHDFRGKDEAKYRELLQNHVRTKAQARFLNERTLREFKKEFYEDKGLR